MSESKSFERRRVTYLIACLFPLIFLVAMWRVAESKMYLVGASVVLLLVLLGVTALVHRRLRRTPGAPGEN